MSGGEHGPQSAAAADSLPAFQILGAILILRSPERARFGDRVAGTRVVFAR